jgi:hypothetical protein
VHVAGLQANDDRASILDARQPRLQRLGLQAALPVDVDQLGRAEARVAKGDVDRLATFDAAEHADPGRPRQAPPIEVPPAALQHGRPRCSQAGRVAIIPPVTPVDHLLGRSRQGGQGAAELPRDLIGRCHRPDPRQ